MNQFIAPDGAAGAPRQACFVGSEVFRRKAFGAHHPLSIPRQSGVLDLCRILGWLDSESTLACPLASERQLVRFHDPDYIEALRKADASGSVDAATRERYRIGTMENPVFAGLFERAATAVGGSILAAQQALDGTLAFHPAGGTHHGRPDRASGFCYFNDPVFAMLTLLDGGVEKLLYVDLDAHHGDGVQDAFAGDRRVFTLSIHEANRWPRTGAVHDRGGGQSRNLPVPPGFSDSELEFLLQQAVLPLAVAFQPEAVVVTCGADGLAGDPLSRLELSNSGLWDAVDELRRLSRHVVVLGGGGYNPWTVVRCWTGLWGRLSGQCIPDAMPAEARQLLSGFECDLVDEEDVREEWLGALADNKTRGPVRREVEEVARIVVQ